MKKLVHTIWLAFTIFRVRTFGEYIHSGWDGEADYVRYKHKNKIWKIYLTSEGENHHGW